MSPASPPAFAPALALVLRNRLPALCGLTVAAALWAPAPAQSAPPAAAPPRALGLGEAIALAVRHNPALAAARVDMQIAAANQQVARGLDDFVVGASASWLGARRELVPGTPVQQPAFDRASGALALSKPLPTGGRLGLELLGDYTRTRYATELDTDAMARTRTEAYAPSLQLTFAHPLLRGLGVDVARADRRRTRAQGDVASLQREAVAAALLRDVVAAYWDLAYRTQELAIRQAAAGSAREQLRRVQANIDVGKQPRSATAEIDVAIALRDEAVLFAEQALVDSALELERLCGQPLDLSAAAGPSWTAADAPTPPAGLPDRTATLQTALARNPQLQTVRAQGRAAAIEVDVTDNGLLPLLDVTLAGGPTGNAAEPGAAYRQLRGLGSYVVTAGLVFQQPIERNAAEGARAAAGARLHRTRLTEADLTRQVTTAVVRGLTAVDIARRRVEVLVRSTAAASLDLDAEKARFEVGRSTNFDVLRRQDALAAAQLVHLRARVDWLKSAAAVDALSGEIFERHGVRLP